MNTLLKRATWLESGDIRPYVFVRPENMITNPGTRHNCDWFKHEPIFKNPLDLKELPFAEAIYQIEWKAFGTQDLAIPRWVFYDCAAMPGFVAGFAGRTSKLPQKVKTLLNFSDENEWCPLSLFIIIPTMHKGEWVAYDLCSVNSLLPKQEQYYGLGFLSKAFALWYANVNQCSGMTQWSSPSLKLHSNYGHLEMIGSYAPVHTHAKTMTYRCEVNTDNWEKFFTHEPDLAFLEKYGKTEHIIDPNDEQSMITMQNRIQNNEGPFYLNAGDIAQKGLRDPLTVYKLKQA
ncbi:MAG: hypothetical protein H7256_05000 [Bdellovibrio sp.]|nr:hypothetical protein [Bdellovibrio sp.]